MRKFLALALALVFSAGAFAQTPSITTTVGNLTPTTITASFEMNEFCTKYHILAAPTGEMEGWTGAFGMSLRDLVISWSLGFEADTTYTWNDMTPNTEYVIYVVAVNATDTSDVLMTTCTTPQAGGEGASVITIELSNITENSVIMTATPNEQTAKFLDGLVEKAMFDEIGADSLITLLLAQPYWLYETDVWEWLDLTPETEYYAFGIGQNAAEQWGEMTLVPFTTLGEGVGLQDAEANGLTLYPNPATNLVSLQNAEIGSLVEVIDMQGRVLKALEVTSTNQTIGLEGMNSGLYVIKTTNGEKTFINKLIVNE